MVKSLAAQHRGGVANLKGNSFEDFFAEWRVLVSLEAALAGQYGRLACQLKNCRVDDWAEDDSSRRRFQLKLKKSVRWSEVATDFAAERARGAIVTLVVGHQKARSRLLKSKHRAGGVLLFNRSLKPSDHWNDSQTGAQLDRLGTKPLTASDRQLICAVITSAWREARKPGYFVSIHQVVKALPDHTLPLRLPWVPTPAWKRAAPILAAIRRFSFRLVDGYFSYDFGNGISGSFSCRTSHFRKFISAVLKNRPAKLADLRGLL